MKWKMTKRIMTRFETKVWYFSELTLNMEVGGDRENCYLVLYLSRITREEEEENEIINERNL